MTFGRVFLAGITFAAITSSGPVQAASQPSWVSTEEIVSGDARADEEPIWDGTTTLTNVPTTCRKARVTFSANMTVTSIAAPFFAQPSIMFLFGDGTFLMSMLNPQFYAGSLMTRAAKLAVAMTASEYTLKVKPAELTPDTRKFTVAGTTQNFANEAGCTVKYTGTFIKRKR